MQTASSLRLFLPQRRSPGVKPGHLLSCDNVTLSPNGTLAGTALRSIQKDTQDSMTIRVAGK